MVVFEEQRPQPGQIVETERDATRKFVGSKVEPNEVTKSEQEVGDFTRKEVTLQVEVSKVHTGSEISRELTSESVEAQTDSAHTGQVAENAGG